MKPLMNLNMMKMIIMKKTINILIILKYLIMSLLNSIIIKNSQIKFFGFGLFICIYIYFYFYFDCLVGVSNICLYIFLILIKGKNKYFIIFKL